MRVRDEIIAEGFLWQGHIYPIGEDIQTTLLVQFQSSQIMPAPSYSWKDIDCIYREVGDAEGFQAFAVAAMMYGKSLFDREEMLQGLVNAAGSVAVVKAISWNTVPDGPA
jgi:hypothetical protein